MLSRLALVCVGLFAAAQALVLPHAERAADETTSSGITASRAKTVLVDLKADIDVQVAVVLATLPNAAQNPHAVAAALQPVAALLVKAKVQLDIKVNVVTFGRKRACTGLLDDVAYDLLKAVADLVNEVDEIAIGLPIVGELVDPVLGSIKGDLSAILGAVRQLVCGVLGLVTDLVGSLGLGLGL